MLLKRLAGSESVPVGWREGTAQLGKQPLQRSRKDPWNEGGGGVGQRMVPPGANMGLRALCREPHPDHREKGRRP